MPTTDHAAETGAQKGPLMRIASIALTVGILWLVFGVILPSIASYDDIWHAFTSMAVPVALLLVAAGLILIVVTSLQLAAGLEGLRPWAAISTHPMAVAIGAIVPGGAVPARAVFLRPFGISTATYTRSYAAAALGVTMCVLLMPAVGLLIFIVVPQSADAADMRPLTLIAGGVSLVIAAVVIAMISSQAACRWLATTAARLVAKSTWLNNKLGAGSWVEAVMSWRTDLMQIVATRRKPLGAAVLATYWLNAALMVGCMYACGLPYGAMGVLIGLGTFTIARLLLAVPLTPGGVGVLELGYSAIFSAMVAEQFDESVVAGVLLYRALTYVMPIFLGGVLLLITRLRGGPSETPEVERSAQQA